MLNRDPRFHSFLAWVLVFAMSAYGGFVKYIIDVQNNELTWSWLAALKQVTIGGFAGLTGGLLAIESDLSIYNTLVAAGMSGTMGSVALNYFWERLTGIKNANQ